MQSVGASDGGSTRWRGARALALAGLLVLAACTRVPEAPLRVGISPWLGYDPLVLAAASGRLDRRSVRMVEMESNEDVMQAVEAGVIEGAALTLDAAIALRRQGAPIVLVALLSESRGADALLAAPGGPDAMAGLRGRRVGLSSITAGSLVLDRALAGAGLARGDVTLVELPALEHADALADGRVDAVVSFEPFLSRLERAGARVLFSTREHPGLVIDVLVLREDALAGRPAAVAALLEALDPELRRFGEPGAADVPAARLSLGLGLGEREYRDALAGIRFLPLAESRRLFADPGPEGFAAWRARAAGHLGPDPDAPVLAVAGPLADPAQAPR